MAIAWDQTGISWDSSLYTWDGQSTGPVTPDPNPIVGTLNLNRRATLDFVSRARTNIRRSGTLETE